MMNSIKNEDMKTIKNSILLTKMVLFFAGLCFGVAAGFMMNNFRSGIALGIATGLTMLIGFLYYKDWLSKRNEKLKNSAIPIVDHKMKKAA
jgi:hypothetical protein